MMPGEIPAYFNAYLFEKREKTTLLRGVMGDEYVAVLSGKQSKVLYPSETGKHTR